jgi:hypothetical protein
MIQWLKSWIAPPIMQCGIVECPVCRRDLKKHMNIFHRRRFKMALKYNGVYTMTCGRCNGQSEWCGTVGDEEPKPFVYLRITWPRGRVSQADLIELAQDAQARYNIKLIRMGGPGMRPDRINFSQYSRKELLTYIKRIESRTKNIKIIK